MNKYHLSALPYHSDSSILFNKIVQWLWAIFLDSCQPQGQQGRYDIMSAKTYKTLSTNGLSTTITDLKQKTQ